MYLSDIPLDKFKPGITFYTKTGKRATVAAANTRPGHFKYYGSLSTNGATNDNDDHWFFFNVEGDDWFGHGMYYGSDLDFEVIGS